MAYLINEISVFFPAYNEEGNVAKTVNCAKDVLSKISKNWEIIVVNDGSKDNTEAIAQKLAKSDSRIKVITHSINKGYGGALKSGFKNSRYEWVAFSDIDGQFDFSEIKSLIEKTKNSDLVLGYRLKRADPLVRKIYTFFWSRLLPRILWGLKVKDYSCGFKLIKRKVFEETQPLVGEEKVTQFELLVKALRKGFRFSEVGVHHYPRKFGKQTGANLKVVLKSITSLFKLWWQLKK